MLNNFMAMMPPLLETERNCGKAFETHYIGGAAEKLVQSYLLNNGINFGEPHVDQGNDLWIAQNDFIKVERCQIKKVLFEYKEDHNAKKRGKEVFRDTFIFRFQGSGDEKRRKYGPDDIDVFYQVLMTSHRQIIFRINSCDIPLDKKENFVQQRNVVLDRSGEGRKPDIDIRGSIVYSMYSPELIQEHLNFFKKPITVFDLAA